MSILHRRYRLPSTRSIGGWAIFVLGSDGYFSVVSDFGNYSFIWTHWGQREDPTLDFRRWLSGCQPDYIASKLNPTVIFDGEQTEKNTRKRIFQLRREGVLTKEQAREMYDSLGSVDFSDSREVMDWLTSEEGGQGEIDFETVASSCLNGEMRGFCEHVWPRFVATLKADLQENPTFTNGTYNEPPPVKP